MTERIHAKVQEAAAMALEESEELRGAGVRVVRQNSLALSELVAKADALAKGVCIVVGVDSVRRIASNPVSWDVRFAAYASEKVALRRAGAPTAIDAAMAAGEILQTAGVGHFESLEHSTPGDGVLEAVAHLSGTFVMDS